MKGTDCFGAPTQYTLDTTQEFSSDAAATAAEIEAQLILGIAKNLGAVQGSLDICNDLYGVAERLAGLLHCSDDEIEDDEEPHHQHQHHQPEHPEELEGAHAEVLAGYSGCMQEALRYLIEDEGLPVTDPLVQGLAHHLLTQQTLLEQELVQQNSSAQHQNDR